MATKFELGFYVMMTLVWAMLATVADSGWTVLGYAFLVLFNITLGIHVLGRLIRAEITRSSCP